MSQIVRMRKQISGTRNGQYWPAPGGTIEVSDDEVELLIRNGQAVHEGEALPPEYEEEELAVVDQTDVETATVPRRGRRPVSAGDK